MLLTLVPTCTNTPAATRVTNANSSVYSTRSCPSSDFQSCFSCDNIRAPTFLFWLLRRTRRGGHMAVCLRPDIAYAGPYLHKLSCLDQRSLRQHDIVLDQILTLFGAPKILDH